MNNLKKTLAKISADTTGTSPTPPTPLTAATNDLSQPRRVTVGVGNSDCPLCHGIGYLREELPLEHPEFGRVKTCSCRLDQEQEARVSQLLRVSNTESLADKTFKNFMREGLSQIAEHRASVEAAYQVSLEFAQNPDGRWLLISGTYGCGKTHLAAAIANELIERKKPVVFLNVTDFLDYLRATFGYNSEESYTSRFENIANAPMLVLDDLGAESPTPWALEKLYQIINHRYNAKLPTVVTTNRDLSRIEARIASRLQDVAMVSHISITTVDYRSGKHRKTAAGYFDLLPPKVYTFHNFQERPDIVGEQAKMLQKTLRAAKKFADNPAGWFILVGGSGTGKTHLSASIGNHQIGLGNEVVYINFYDFMDIAYSYGSKETDDDLEPANPKTVSLIWKLKAAALLILDDIPEKLSAYVRSKFYQVILYRFELQLPTVISSEAKFDKLDGRFASRILNSNFCEIHVLQVPAFKNRKETLPQWYTPLEKRKPDNKS